MDTKLSLSEIKTEVFKHRPVLKEIYTKFGNWKLGNYVKEAWEVPKQKPDEAFLSIIGSFVNDLYGFKLSSQAKNQLLAKPLVSTIDHLGIWGHPIFVNAGLIYSLHFNSSDLAISLATESVSLNNTSSWSGSVLSHNEDGNLHRHSFFPDKIKTLPVFSTPGITLENVEHFRKSFGKGAENIVNALKIDIARNNFSSQACVASFNLWQKVFPSAPKLIYLPLESIVLEYIKNVFEDEQNIIRKIIFTPTGRELWQKYFGNEHTFMFWAINAKGRRVVLKSITNDSNQLLQLIGNRKIYPSSPLCFMVLLLTGFACVGGFTQTTWLTEVKKKFIDILKELNASQDVILNISNIPTKNFAESSLASLKIGEHNVLPTAVDLLLTGKDYYGEFLKKSENITLGESLDIAMPGIYEVVVGKKLEIRN